VRQRLNIREVDAKKRVLRPGLTAKQQTLLLLYHEPTQRSARRGLYSWIEYDQLRTYRRDVLWPLHNARLIEFDEGNDAVHLSPTGAHEGGDQDPQDAALWRQ
jgi:hypothetical protein